MLTICLTIASGLACAYAQTIVELAANDNDLTTLVSALTDTNLTDTLSGTGPFTVLAPTDTAFSAITVPSDNAVLKQVLLYHVISGSNISASDLSSGLVATMADSDGQTVTVSLDGGVFFYDSMGRMAEVVQSDIIASNGIIHKIDTVLLPDGTINDITGNVATLSSLDGALAATMLNTTLADTTSNFTLFAPSNDAVAAFKGEIDSDLLLYHVVANTYLSTDVPTSETPLTTVQGTTIRVVRDAEGGVSVSDAAGNLATVTTANIAGTNGVVHIIDVR